MTCVTLTIPQTKSHARVSHRAHEVGVCSRSTDIDFRLRTAATCGRRRDHRVHDIDIHAHILDHVQPALFSNHVVRFPFPDHQPPPMQLMYDFCLDAQRFLSADDRNVVFVHCKAGKGRTGVMICAYLLFTGSISDTSICMSYYGMKRTTDAEGVTIPSQRRYIDYFASLLSWPAFRRAQMGMSDDVGGPVTSSSTSHSSSARMAKDMEANLAALEELQVITPVNNKSVVVRVSTRDADGALVEVFGPEQCSYEQIGRTKLKAKVPGEKVFFRGDIKIEVMQVKNARRKQYKKLFYFWQHAAFLPQTGVVRMHGTSCLDKVKSGLKKEAIFVELHFDIRDEGSIVKAGYAAVGARSLPDALLTMHSRAGQLQATGIGLGSNGDPTQAPHDLQSSANPTGVTDTRAASGGHHQRGHSRSQSMGHELVQQLQEELMEVRDKSNSVISEQAEKIQELERLLSSRDKSAGGAAAAVTAHWTLPSGVTAGELRYPVPGRLKIAGLMNYVYERPFALLVDLSVPAGMAPSARAKAAVRMTKPKLRLTIKRPGTLETRARST